MTYCVAARLNTGMVFLADTRTNAGVDHISTFRKLRVFERPGERVIVLMTSGNLAISQSIINLLSQQDGNSATSLWHAASMHDAAERVGEAVRSVHERDAQALQRQGIDFNINLILGGQIGNAPCQLFQIYSAGNFIEASSENPYLQIGEAKYGKPILDRVLRADTSLDEAAKCALVSMDSTLRSNVSVGMPLDLLVYETGSLRVTHFASIDENNQYFATIRRTWGERLKQVFAEITDPVWTSPDAPDTLVPADRVHQPIRMPSDTTGANSAPTEPFPAPQTLAQDHGKPQRS
ncbi:proteasome-type protease [Paracandidimonas soli]|uniref:Putative proteasome-type protease n=1 Tax=Paracandidimonas soli TaxID=1917182 RepID=A0A4R3VAK4_9BURK|nr:proteasome-type protease [Paracandidimonas soli]TCV00612.1 putative proteasome-type protease [Paracandidimonas soli]